MNEVLAAIRDRRSNRGYSEVQLTKEQTQALIDAALQAPTARNTQMWHFSVVQNKELLDKFSEDYAKLAASRLPADARVRFEDGGFHLFYHAPTVIFISRPSECANRFVEVDCGIACENIALAAQGLGLGSVIIGMPMDLFLSDLGAYYKEAFGFPEGYQFSIGIAVGNPTLSKEAHPIGEDKVNIVR